jgi:hypothetical protein
MGLFSSLVQGVLERTAARDLVAFAEAVKTPIPVQQRLLFDIVRREQPTAFGRDHGFAEIRTLADFRRRVPITRYEYFEPYIERVKQGELDAMFHRQKVLMFALTSGTTSPRKFIPITERFLADYRRVWTAWGLHVFMSHPELFRLGKLTFASDDDEFRTPSGIPCGSISGLTARMQHWLVRGSYVMPPQAAKLHDVDAKYYLAWRLGVQRQIGMWVSPNPSTHLNLARFGERHAETILRDVHNGTLCPDFPLPAALVRTVQAQLKPNPKRARELTAIAERTGSLTPKDVWPMLELIGCWTGGSMAAYLRNFPEHFGNAVTRDIGLIASEARMTVSKDDNSAAGILEITSNYYEFVPVDEIESPQPTVLEAHELIEGRDYYILLTTNNGLYRYNIFDVVRCVGSFEQTPMLVFLNKGSGISNLTGEKLTEYQVSTAVAAALAELDQRLGVYSLAPVWRGEIPYYGLFVEAGDVTRNGVREQLAEAVERQLHAANMEYAAKRATRRLDPVQVHALPDGAWRAWDEQRLSKSSGTAEQYKHPCLITDLDFGRRQAESEWLNRE